MKYFGTITNVKLVQTKGKHKVVITTEIPFIIGLGGAQRNYADIHSGKCTIIQDE
jgi:hypothetical protein